jgi:hypothetical protein
MSCCRRPASPLAWYGSLTKSRHPHGRGAADRGKASVFLFASVGLMTFNMHWLDVAGFLVGIRR